MESIKARENGGCVLCLLRHRATLLLSTSLFCVSTTGVRKNGRGGIQKGSHICRFEAAWTSRWTRKSAQWAFTASGDMELLLETRAQ